MVRVIKTKTFIIFIVRKAVFAVSHMYIYIYIYINLTYGVKLILVTRPGRFRTKKIIAR